MTVTASSPLIRALSDGLRGPVIAQDDETYDAARTVYNAMIDRRPSVVAYCADVADVIAAVRTCHELDAAVSVRGGGHNGGGLGIWDDAACIDLSSMRGISVDPAAKTVRVDGGCTWGDVDHATHPFGLATPAGIISTTGVGGLTLGGGIGHLSRHCGLTIDNLLSADVVLADGSFVTANADDHPDLYWALRGGGGNFGIVTSFQFRCHDVSNVLAGPVLYDLGDTGEVLRWYRQVLPELPEEISGFFAFLTVPPAEPFPEELWLRKMCGIVWNYSGPMDRGPAALAEVRAFGRPVLDGIQEMPYPMLQSAFDALYPPGLQWYWRADFFSEISDPGIAVHEAYGAVPTMQSTMHLYPIDGAAHRVGPEETAFAYRDAIWSGVIAGVDPDPGNAGLIRDWTVDYFDALHPTSAGGAYVNFMMDGEGSDRVKASYRHNYERLAQVKAHYDPDNFFRINQNIVPAG